MDKLELFLNEQRADLAAFRVILQVFLINLASRDSEPRAMLHELRDQVMDALAKLPVEPSTAQGDERMKQLTLIRAEAVFQQLEDLQAQVESMRAGKKS